MLNELNCLIFKIHHKKYILVQGARKALSTRWSTPATLSNMMFGSGSGADTSLIDQGTPSKSLLGTDTSNSMLFSPPSILKVNIQLNQAINKQKYKRVKKTFSLFFVLTINIVNHIWIRQNKNFPKYGQEFLSHYHNF